MDKTDTAKKELRRAMRARLAALPPAYFARAGESIREQVLSSPEYRDAQSVFVYVSMPGEPPTDGIIRRALLDGKRVFVPKCVGKEMLAVRVRDVEALAPGAYGIPEPADADETETAEALDLILVPCAAASGDGRRLGRGAGYYDRFLQGPRGRTVCLCFRETLLDDLPVTERDVRMDRVLTERQPLCPSAHAEEDSPPLQL